MFQLEGGGEFNSYSRTFLGRHSQLASCKRGAFVVSSQVDINLAVHGFYFTNIFYCVEKVSSYLCLKLFDEK